MNYEKIETVEQLEQLPVGSVYMETTFSDWQTDPRPIVWLRISVEDIQEPLWSEFGGHREWPIYELAVPGIVLWRPAA
ncbi:hypothetical protein [Nocardia jiangxiensis]|uniref:hypothetical protein n=1 Tax=Nocardia jiangxiensis TaxID=282685 RepID=UPI0002ECC238|nr:hypothetical protein [Nocardia jiangxiensis]